MATTMSQLVKPKVERLKSALRLPGRWSIRVERPYSFRTDVVLDFDAVYDSFKTEFPLQYNHGAGYWIALYPCDVSMRKTTPDPRESFVPRQNTTFDETDELISWLTERWGRQKPTGLEWLDDWVERHHFEAMADDTRGIGTARSQQLYDRYQTLQQLLGTPDSTLESRHNWLDSQQIENIKTL